MLDLRLPTGLFFAIVGLLLIAVSFTSPRAPMTDANVDLYTGAAMLAFGGVMLLLALRSRKA
jgi:hypothetical protein